jgi:hypothetical protein
VGYLSRLVHPRREDESMAQQILRFSSRGRIQAVDMPLISISDRPRTPRMSYR